MKAETWKKKSRYPRETTDEEQAVIKRSQGLDTKQRRSNAVEEESGSGVKARGTREAGNGTGEVLERSVEEAERVG